MALIAVIDDDPDIREASSLVLNSKGYNVITASNPKDGYTIVKEQNPDLIIDELRIVHFTHDGEVNEYVLEYLKSDIEKMLKYYKKQLILRKYEEENKPIIF